MFMSPVGLRSEKGCAGDAQQKLKSTDPHQETRNCQKNQKVNGKNWSRVLDGCLIKRRTGRLTVGRNITLNFTRESPFRGGLEYLHHSPESRKRRQKGNQVPGGITVPPCSWGDINTGTWSSRLGESDETVKYGLEFCGTSTQE
jgi:hypothetical protein